MTPVPASTLEAARAAVDRAALFHLNDPNVVLIDIGWRIRDRQGHCIEEDELCVRVHLRRKLRGDAFRQFAAQHPERIVHEDEIGFALDFPGDVNYRPHLFAGGWGGFRRHGQAFRTLRGGISISNAMVYTYGTLGGLVRDRDRAADMILSNWHVLAGPGLDRPGLPIYQPGTQDGGGPVHTVATLTRHAMDQNIDAAVASLTGVRPLINEQLEIGPVTGVTQPQLGMRVTKSGRGTDGMTDGIITGMLGRKIMNYGGVPRMVREHIHIAQTPEGGEVSAPGDSGSWWLDAETHQAVALHFGGNSNPEYGLAISMPSVLEALHVDPVVA